MPAATVERMISVLADLRRHGTGIRSLTRVLTLTVTVSEAESFARAQEYDCLIRVMALRPIGRSRQRYFYH